MVIALRDVSAANVLPAELRVLPDRRHDLSDRARKELSRDLARLEPLQELLGYSFARPALLRAALTLQSWVNEHPRAGWISNGRLEYFGDAVLDLVSAEHLYGAHPQAGEGELTRRRARLVEERALARAARALGLGEYLWVGTGDASTGARTRPSTLADAVEAVLAAIYFDAREADCDALAAVRAAFVRHLSHEFDDDARSGERAAAEDGGPALDPKSELQQVSQRHGWGAPHYIASREDTADTEPVWQVEVELGGPDGPTRYARVRGASLRSIEREAALLTLERLDELKLRKSSPTKPKPSAP